MVEQLKQFLIELGRDFCYIGSQYPIQVGGRDFSLDLLFFNRALNCLVAFELKLVLDSIQLQHPLAYNVTKIRHGRGTMRDGFLRCRMG